MSETERLVLWSYAGISHLLMFIAGVALSRNSRKWLPNLLVLITFIAPFFLLFSPARMVIEVTSIPIVIGLLGAANFARLVYRVGISSRITALLMSMSILALFALCGYRATVLDDQLASRVLFGIPHMIAGAFFFDAVRTGDAVQNGYILTWLVLMTTVAIPSYLFMLLLTSLPLILIVLLYQVIALVLIILPCISLLRTSHRSLRPALKA